MQAWQFAVCALCSQPLCTCAGVGGVVSSLESHSAPVAGLGAVVSSLESHSAPVAGVGVLRPLFRVHTWRFAPEYKQSQQEQLGKCVRDLTLLEELQHQVLMHRHT